MVTFRSQTFGKKNTKIVIIVTGWGMGLASMWIPAFLLTRNGYHVITYAYDKEILSPDDLQTKMNFLFLKNTIEEKIKDLKKNGYTSFYIFGTSLGSVIALMVANEFQDISKIILNLIVIDLADAVWSWKDKLHTDFANAFTERNVSLSQLKSSWNQINPVSNMDHLTDKKILVYLATKDTIFPFKEGVKMVNALKQNQYQNDVIINNKFNHIISAWVNLCISSYYIRFFEE